MVADIIPPTKTYGGRPPYTPPPAGTTFSQEPDDHRQDMLVHLRDNVERLIRASRDVDIDGASQFLSLLDQRRAWVLGEMQTERLLADECRAPLGIEEDPYDLSALNLEFEDPRMRAYRLMLEMIDCTRQRLEQQLSDQKHGA